jgi:hypothetical protein
MQTLTQKIQRVFSTVGNPLASSETNFLRRLDAVRFLLSDATSEERAHAMRYLTLQRPTYAEALMQE